MKCIREHCEFACGGYCALVCPFGLTKRMENEEARKKIEACVRMLKRVKKRTKRVKDNGLPKGVSLYEGSYIAYICYKGKHIQLGKYANAEDAEETRAKAEEAKQNGKFPQWLKKFKAAKEKAKRGKKTAVKGSAAT